MLTGPVGRSVKRALRQIYPVQVPQPRWERLLGDGLSEWKPLVASLSQGGPAILLAPSNGHPAVTTMDSLLAVALTLRGASVHILMCDEALPACQNSRLDMFPDEWVANEFVRYGPKRDLCPSCFAPAYAMFRSLGLPVHRYSEFVSDHEIEIANRISGSVPFEEIRRYSADGIPIGEHAVAGAIRFFASNAVEREETGEAVLRQYLCASLRVMYATMRLLERYRYACVSVHHGIYVPQGIISAVARHKGARVVTWCQAYRKNSFIFSHNDTYHRTLMSEPVANWSGLDWTPEIEREILEYLGSRQTGAKDWISFSGQPEFDVDRLGHDLGIDFSRPCVGLLTNVMWDAQLHYAQNVFADMLDWLFATIRYFAGRPDLQLVIRVHPAEIRGQIRSRQPVVEEIARELGRLPANVFVIGPEHPISTYAVMRRCDSVLVYGTKTGVELTSVGIPVVVAGEAWVRNKGLTLDASSRGHYFELLDQLPLRARVPSETVAMARKYAYHFFFRRMIPLKVLSAEKGNGWCPYGITSRSLTDLLPGRDSGLDVICEGIITGREFIYPAEELGAASQEHVG